MSTVSPPPLLQVAPSLVSIHIIMQKLCIYMPKALAQITGMHNDWEQTKEIIK